MRVPTILLVLAACGCSGPSPQAEPSNTTEGSQDVESGSNVRAEFLQLTGNDSWADWPVDLVEDPNDHGRACIRVTEPMRETAIALLEEQSAVPVDDAQYRRLIGTARPPGGGSPYLLRAFSSTNSTARVKWAGDTVVVHTDALGRLFDVRRHPCISILRRAPDKVHTVAAYDL